MIDSSEIFQRLGVTLGLGLLVGSVREKAESQIAGVRTYPLITLTGAMAALLALKFGGWVIAAGFISIASILVMANLHKMAAEPEHKHAGITTEIAALLMYGVGAYTMIGELAPSLCVGACATLLLHFKKPLHSLLEKIGDKDIHAVMQFVLIALVILPIMPDEDIGPYGVFNPFQTWMVVVLIVALSLSAYIAYRIFGAKMGTAIGGILGGLISSTATTVSYANKAKSSPKVVRSAATVICIASTISFVRMMGEIFVMAPNNALTMSIPLAIALSPMLLGSGFLLIKSAKDNSEMLDQENPAQLKSALVFGFLYTLIGYAVALGKDLLGNNGLYIVGAISGLTDVDALTISTANMTENGKLGAHIAWQVILLGGLANLFFKAATLTIIAKSALAKYVLPVFIATGVVGAILIFAYPEDNSISEMLKKHVPAQLIDHASPNDSTNSNESKDSKKSPNSKDSTDAAEPKELKDSNNSKNSQDSTDSAELKDSNNSKDSKDKVQER